MDDLYISNDDVEKAVNIMSSTKACLSLGSFNLSKWNSNLAAFLQQVNRDLLLSPNEASPQNQKVHGLSCNAKTDTYVIDKKTVHKPLNLNEYADITQLQNELRDFRDISIPRCLFFNKIIKVPALYTFSDASEYALSAVSYLKID